MPTPHSTLVGANLHYNMGDSRSATAWTLAAGTSNALLIENSNGNDFLTITTSVTPGASTITLGNATDLPNIRLRGLVEVQNATVGTIFSIGTGTSDPLSVVAAAGSGPHTLLVDESWIQIAETPSAPTNVAGSGFLYTRDDAGTTRLTFMRDNGTTVDLDAAASSLGGTTGGTDNAVIRADGTGGSTVQASVVTIGDTGAMAGVTDYQQTSGPFSHTGNGTITLGNGGTGTITMSPGSGGLTIELLDNDSANFLVEQGSDDYIRVDTTDGSEQVIIGSILATANTQVVAGNDVIVSTGGDVDFQVASGAGSSTAFRVRDGASLTDVYLSVDTSADLVTIGNATTGATGVTINAGTTGFTVNVADNDTAAMTVQQGANIYLRVVTSNSGERLIFGDTSLNQRFDFNGSGAVGRPNASGTNTAGQDMRVRAGAGTGAGTPGILYLGSTGPEASGTTVQTQIDRVAIAGSTTTTSLLIGNPDADNTVATPVTDVTIGATNGNGATQATDILVKGGTNSSTGRGGHGTYAAGASVDGAGGDASLVAGDSDNSTPGVLRLATNGDVSGIGTDRITIPGSSGDVQLVYQGATSMPVHSWQRYRVTHNSATQTVLTYAVPSGASAYVDVRAVWNRSSATTGSALATVFGGCWNDGGTTDEIGGSTFTSTMVARSGQANTDTVDVQVVADNGTDELQIQLTKANANDYTVDLFVLVHVTA